MSRLKAGRKLDALDAKIAALEAERRALEIRALGAEIADTERRDRYFTIPDLDTRRKAIRTTRMLQELRAAQRATTVEYWSAVTDETRAKLADLTSDAPGSSWRRGAWWDVATLFWIFTGAGWLYRGWWGALIGAGITAAWSWFILRNRKRARPGFIRQGEDKLRSSESELHQAQRYAAQPPVQAAFSSTEEDTGIADDAEAHRAEA
jgi:hypothetical protein